MNEQNCPSCGRPMIMYYGIQCFACNKPKPREIYSLIPVCYYIAFKNNIDPEIFKDVILDGASIPSNDSICDLPYLDEIENDSEFKKYLEMINEEFNIKETAFEVSW